MPRPSGGPSAIINDEILVEHGLHFLERIEPGAAAFDAEMLVKQRAVQTFDDAVGLRAFDLGALVLDPLQLQEQLIGVLVLAATEFAAIIAEHGVDGRSLGLEGGQHLVIDGVDRGQGQLVGIEPGPAEHEIPDSPGGSNGERSHRAGPPPGAPDPSYPAGR